MVSASMGSNSLSCDQNAYDTVQGDTFRFEQCNVKSCGWRIQNSHNPRTCNFPLLSTIECVCRLYNPLGSELAKLDPGRTQKSPSITMVAVAMHNSAPTAAYEFTSYPYRRYEEFDYRQMFGPHEFHHEQCRLDNRSGGSSSTQAVWYPDQSQPMIPVSYGRQHGDFSLPSQALLEHLILEIPEYSMQVWQVGWLHPRIIIDVSWDFP
ncbi:hypothetical protein WOLCODRAFT_17672 [Wolfiporia cocos MD-104 SS10]|uniref:Uncharacterized protein n=1 Tax=Wolfiporia cocos (strain MD-104) TaxID=742152 RepID=A0A2H3JKI3_WOLCO|nr:hypothetical protein WOLCODRAFT_17672 [Wolfiporia cocos MD-104 SS10]